MSGFTTPSGLAAVEAAADRSPKRKVSIDLARIKNFPSTLSLRKAEADTPVHADGPPSSGTLSRLKAFGQSQRSSRSSTGGELGDTLADTKSTKRTSRLLDAFKPSRKPAPSFEVVRKPPNRSTTSFHSSQHQVSPQLEVQRPASRLSVHRPPDIPEPAPRLSLSTPHSEPASPPVNIIPTSTLQEALNARSPYPPSTTKTRRYSGNPTAANGRRTSDPHLNLGSTSTSQAYSPSASPNLEAVNGRFNLHSFRNVRSTSDVSNADDPAAHTHSRVQSIISIDEYVTPGEELPEPSFIDDGNAAAESLPSTRPKLSDVGRAQSTSPVANARPASISAAKFRQASRQRSESGNIPTLDTIQSGGSGFTRPSRSRTPSQDLAAIEAVLTQTNHSANRAADADRRKSAGPVTLASAVPAGNLNDDLQRRRRGFFIVVEGLDRAGKSTQVERLAEHLSAKAIKFPERTTAIGQMINSYLAQTSDLDDQAIHLLFSANRWECVASIKRTLEAGESIVCDRYAFSGIAYSVAKGLSYDWCRNPDVGLPLPDLTMFLDLDAETAAARGGYGEERYEKLDFQAKVRDAFSHVSHDVRTHGGRWVTIDASKTLDQVTEDIQKAVQRVTSSIDRVGSKLGKLFVSERPPNERAGSSSELYPPAMLLNVKRSSMSSEDSGRRGKSLDQTRPQATATTNGSFPASRPSGSPLTYSEQLAAVRAAAAGTLSGLFGGSNATLDQHNQAMQPEADGPSPTNGLRGQGFDSARVLAKYPEVSGKRRTLIDVIGELEGRPQPQLHQQVTRGDQRRSVSAAAESTSPSLPSPSEGFASTFPQGAGRVRRSTDHGRVPQLPSIASSNSPPHVAPRSDSLTVPDNHPADAAVSARSTPASAEKQLPSSSNMRVPSYSSAGSAGGADSRLAPSPAVQSSSFFNDALAVSPAVTNSSRSSIASQPPPAASTPPVPRPASVGPREQAHVETNFATTAAVPYLDPNSSLSTHHLSMLNVQQGQAEIQEQYMRNYMAMMANPVLAQQAHYQLMLQRHQQQYYGRAASAIGLHFGAGVNNLGAGANGNGVVQQPPTQDGGGPPSAAFMQPHTQVSTTQQSESAAVNTADTVCRATNVQQARMRSTHKRTQSSASLLDSSTSPAATNAVTSSSTTQPMLSMMMAPPPASIATSNNGTNGFSQPASPSFSPQYYQPHAQQHMYAQQHMLYPNGGFPQIWGQQPQALAAGYGVVGGGARALYPSSRSEIAAPSSGLRTHRSTETGLGPQQQQH